MVITWCVVRTIRCVHKKITTKSFWRVTCSVVMKHNLSRVRQNRAILRNRFLPHSLNWLSSSELVKRKHLIVDDSSLIPTNTPQNLPCSQHWLEDHFCRPTAIRWRPVFTVSDTYFITNLYTPQWWVDFVAFQQWFTNKMFFTQDTVYATANIMSALSASFNLTARSQTWLAKKENYEYFISYKIILQVLETQSNIFF